MFQNLPIHTLVVPFTAHNLRRKIVWSTAKCPRNIRDFLREAKVRDLEMSMPVQQEILGFEIPVDDVHAVQIIQREGDFGGIEFGYGIREALSRSFLA